MIWLAVAAGGALGAMARFGLHLWLMPAAGKFPLATFVANVLGCFLMGILFVLVIDKQVLSVELRPLLMVGFLGAFTTFSSFSLEVLSLWQLQQFTLAAAYMIGSLLACIIAVWLGYTLSVNAFK